MAIFLSILFGFVPMFFYAAFVNWLDRYEQEPKILLGFVFFWGAFIAAGAAFLFNTIFGIGIYIFTASEEVAEITTTSLVAPIIEECLKGFAVLLVFWKFRQEFDSVLDGLVYAAVTALGFAATENALYIYNMGFAESGWSGFIVMVLIRVLLVGWQHPFYTAFTGITLALARLNPNKIFKVIVPSLGLGAAILMHALHNTINPLLINQFGLAGMALGSFFDWTGWIAMFAFVVWMVFREANLLKVHLQEEIVLGNLTPEQYQAACSASRQNNNRLQALGQGNFRATSRFYQLCGELAHKKNQFAALGDDGQTLQIIENIRAELRELSTNALA